MQVRRPQVKIIYDGKDITADVSSYLLSLTYTDKAEGESDEVEITLEDTDGKWIDEWYPDKGSKLEVSIGYDGALMKCGKFEIDDITHSGPPDTITIRALAAVVKKSLRTQNNKAYENQTLKQIAQQVASQNGLILEGDIPNIQFERVTQNRETDLGFLKRISNDYGCLFSVRENRLTFTSIFDIEKGRAVVEIDRGQLKGWNFRDKTSETFKGVKVQYHNPTDKKVVTYETQQKKNQDGIEYSEIVAGDTKVIRAKAETQQQAEAKGKAALHRANSQQQSGDITVEGTVLLVAGNNIIINGMGKFSGKWNIVESRHTFSRSGGYTTDTSMKRVGSGGKKKSDSRPKNT